MPHTLAQKILQAHTDEEVREAGQIVNCHLSGVLANDITGPLAIKSFRAMGAAKVFDKDRVFLVMDHFTPQKDIDSANQVMVTRKFAQEMDVTHYYEGGDCGVEHALLPQCIHDCGLAILRHAERMLPLDPPRPAFILERVVRLRRHPSLRPHGESA